MKKKGFTLVELLAVILVIAILQIMKTIDSARLRSMEDSIEELQNSTSNYQFN